MLKEGVSVLFLRRPLTILVKGKIWRVVVVFLEVTFLENPDDLSDYEPETRVVVSAVLVVTDVLVSPSSVDTECYENVSLDSDWEFVEPRPFSFSKKRSSACAENQGEMSYEGSPVKAPPNTRRRMKPPTPQQFSHSSTDEGQWQADLEAQRSIWSTRERRVTAAMEKYLDKRDDMKVEVEALELLMDPEDSEV